MKVVIQKSKKASVSVENQVIGEISHGFVLLVGINEADTQEDVDYILGKVSKMRIFDDKDGKMNLSLEQVQGQILSISQFTLFADTKKGNRPSFIKAARPELAIPLYEALNQGFRDLGFTVATGEFGGDMQVSLINDGPVTVILDSQNR
ncbi:D-aminoacyl-tRNA deacylase [Carnobacterium gallinarum]|uniref:D-aminoacyl-tRNA deacylase n=1 Tax=Carnobacterium gallinarum TaxID=2749 RepID=UPI000558F76F|nr:D-aminoacyl-tRNA deacylase [Carnobacterium gallinarum]